MVRMKKSVLFHFVLLCLLLSACNRNLDYQIVHSDGEYVVEFVNETGHTLDMEVETTPE